MTSKEAIKSIEKQSTVEFLNYNKSFCLFEQELKVLQKDLDVLEILKKYIRHENSYGIDMYDFNKVFYEVDETWGDGWETDIEEYKKIKEWLK